MEDVFAGSSWALTALAVRMMLFVPCVLSGFRQPREAAGAARHSTKLDSAPATAPAGDSLARLHSVGLFLHEITSSE